MILPPALIPYRWLLFGLLLAAAFASGAAGGWTVQGWRLTGVIADLKAGYATEQAIAQANARRKEHEHARLAESAEKNRQLAAAQNRALAGELRRLAAESGGLRDPYARPANCAAAPASQPAGAAAGEAGRLPEGGAGLLSRQASDFILEQAELADDIAAYAWACHEWAKGLGGQ